MYYEKSEGNNKKTAIQRRREIVMRDEEDFASVHDAIQPKLEISQPEDAQEKEADLVAKNVVQGSTFNVPGSVSASGINTKSEGDSTLYADDKLQRQLDSSKGSGQAMDDATKSEMETKMGADFSGVKIHTDSAAHAMSEDINAKAFTHGQDIYFKNLQYDPKGNAGKELLAHELWHTRQNGGGVGRKVWRKAVDPGTKKEFMHLSPALSGFAARDDLKLMSDITKNAREEYTLKSGEEITITYDTDQNGGWYYVYPSSSNYKVAGYLKKEDVRMPIGQEIYKVKFWGEDFDLQVAGRPILGFDYIYQLWYKGSSYRLITNMGEVPVEGYNKLGMGSFATEVQSILTGTYLPDEDDKDWEKANGKTMKDDLLEQKDRGLPLTGRFSAPRIGVPISNTANAVIMKAADGTDFVIRAEQYIVNIDPKHQYLIYKIHVISDGKDYTKEIDEAEMLQVGFAFFVFASKGKQKLPDLASSKYKEDFPASLPEAERTEKGFEMIIDSDGDQHKELSLLLHTKKLRLSKGKEDKNNYMCLSAERIDNGSKTEVNTRWWLTDDEVANLNVSFYQRTDGKIPTTYQMMNLMSRKNYGSFQLYPPALIDRKLEYKGSVDGHAFGFNLSGLNTKTYSTFLVGDSGQYGDKFFFDLALGLYQDIFRFIFERDTDTSCYLTIFSATGKLLDKHPKIKLFVPKPSFFNVLASENPGDNRNVGCFIDFNGDGKEDLIIYDRLAVTYSNDDTSDKVTAESQISDAQRYHYINLVTPAIGSSKETSGIHVFKIDPVSFNQFNKIDNLNDLDKYAEFSLATLFKKDKNENDFFAELEGVTVVIEALKKKLLDEGKIDKETQTSWVKLSIAAHALYPSVSQKTPDALLSKKYEANLDDFWMKLAKEEVKRELKAFFSSERYKVSTGNINDPAAYFKPYFVYAGFYADFLHDVLDESGLQDDETTQLKNYAEAQKNKIKELYELKDNGAKKAKAYHYPLNVETPGKQKIEYVPLELYYWRKNGDWYVKDITNPSDPQQKSYSAKDGESIPPKELFEQLNYTGKFVEGMMYVEVAGKEGLYRIQTEEKTSVSTYLAYAGMALLAIGIALTGVGLFFELGAATAAGVSTVAGLAFAGSELLFAASGTLSIYDNWKNGTLTVGNFAFDAVMIVASCLGAVESIFGTSLKMAKATGKSYTGFVGKIILAGDKYLIPLTRASKNANNLVMLEVSIEGMQQIKELAESAPDSPERDRAIFFHISMLVGMGLIHAKVSGPAIRDIKGGQSIFKYTNRAGKEAVVSVTENLRKHLDDLVMKGENVTVQRLFGKTTDAYQLERLMNTTGDIRMVDRMLVKCVDGAQLEVLLVKVGDPVLLERILSKCISGDELNILLGRCQNGEQVDRLLIHFKKGTKLLKILSKCIDGDQLEMLLSKTKSTTEFESLLFKCNHANDLERLLGKVSNSTILLSILNKSDNSIQAEKLIDAIGDGYHVERLISEAGSIIKVEDLINATQGMPPSVYQQFNFKQLNSIEKDLQRWGVGAKGNNQGVDHIYGYAFGGGGAGKENRLVKLQEYYGGIFSINDPQLVSKVNDVLDNMIKQSPLPPKGTLPKEVYFYPKNNTAMPSTGFSNSQKGIVIIKYDNKFSSFMNTSFKDFNIKNW